MEEKIQSLLTTIWETSLNIEDEELIVKKLHKICFQDPLKSDQIVFLCSRLINSELNLFKYIEANCGDKERKSTGFRRRILEFLKEFIIYYSSYCIEYLEYIRNICSGIYIAEQSLIVKEKTLALIAKVIQHFDTGVIERIYKPKLYLEFLLDEIKLKKLGGTIKGGIWHIIGILLGKYSLLLNDYKIEIHDVLFHELKNLLNVTKKFELKAVVGILKGYNYLLEDPHLKADQVNQLYIFLKSLMKPLEDANSIKINKLALEVISSHGKVFYKQLQKDSIILFDSVFDLCNHKNYELKMAANEAIEKISLHISECLMEDNDLHKDAFKYLILKIKSVLEMSTGNILINTAISLIGIFANAIVRFMGESILQKYLEDLIVRFDKDILHALGKEAFKAKSGNGFVNQSDSDSGVNKPSKSIKYILAIQKQYISLLNSYSNIIGNLSHITELVVNHCYKILLVGFSAHQKFYDKYKERLTESIASIIVNMLKHQNFFWSFLRKVVKNGFIESIKMTTNMIFKENVETTSITVSVKFWVMLLSRWNIFTEFTVTKVTDQLITEIVDLLSSLNLNYKEASSEKTLSDNCNTLNDVHYEAENASDLEIFNRASLFLGEFMKEITGNKSFHKLISPWILVILRKFCGLINTFPRISACYTAMSSVMKYCHKCNFFIYTNEEMRSFISEFENFNKSIVKKIEIFQDDLLLSSIELLLSIPTVLIKIIYTDDSDNLKYIFKRAFEIGFNDIRYAKLALCALKNWLDDDCGELKLSEKNKNSVILKEILPIFGDYLIEYEKIKESIDTGDVEMIERYTKIQNKILKILGNIGGSAHNVISSVKYKSNEVTNKKTLLNIMNSKKVEYSFPLYNKKYNVFFDHILIKIADIALNSLIKEKKFASSEVLHSLILYIIGSETHKSNVDNTNILVFLIDKVLYLACDLDKAISAIYETLLFQIIHWMSKKGSLTENKDIISLLDIIIESTSSRKNLKLREISSDCVCEYIKWFIRQHTDITVKDKAATIKYLIRRVESNAQHPDAFKRLGAALCFEKMISVICLNDSLVDKFIIEICSYCVAILKISHHSTELADVIFKHVLHSSQLLVGTMSKKYHILSKTNQKRNFFKNLREFFEFLYDKLMIPEIESRYLSQFLWIQLFDLLHTELGCNSPKEYFENNNTWPKIPQELIKQKNFMIKYCTIYYQFMMFLNSNHILPPNDLGYYYPRFSFDNIIQDLHWNLVELMDMKTHNENENINLVLSFIYITDLLFTSSNSSMQHLLITKLSEMITENSNTRLLLCGKNIVHSILEIVYNIFYSSQANLNFYKLLDVKYFIRNEFANVIQVFMKNLDQLMHIILKCKGKEYINTTVEGFLSENISMFGNLNEQQNIENLTESLINESIIHFYFGVISDKECIVTRNFLTVLKGNFMTLLTLNHPKFLPLLKSYFSFLFSRDFQFISSILNESQFNFDFLADNFFTILISTYKSGSSCEESTYIEDFISHCLTNDERIPLVFILLERCTILKHIQLIDLISNAFINSIQAMHSMDSVINQIKIATMIVFNYIEGVIKYSPVEIDSLAKVISLYIDEKTINVVKEVVNFLGLMVKLLSGNVKIISDVKMFYLRIQSRYFPIKTKYLSPNTKEWNDFQLIFNCVLNTFKTVKSFEFLEILFPIIREEKTEYSRRVKASMKEYIKEVLTTYSPEMQVNEIQKGIDVFLSNEIDRNLRDNIRFTLMKILVYKFISKCDVNVLVEILVRNYRVFEKIIKTSFEDIAISNENKFILAIEKTCVYTFLEICFTQLPSERLKGEVHKKLFGEGSQGNELTKILIIELHNAKRMKIPNWDAIIKSIKIDDLSLGNTTTSTSTCTNSNNQQEKDLLLYLHKIENRFYCAAYTCLSALIKSTQTKEEVFVKFLFQTVREKNEKLWELLVNQDFVYHFTVETNFMTRELNKEKKEIDKSSGKLLIDELITDSFFHDAYGKTLKETLTLEQKSLLTLDNPSEFSKIILDRLDEYKKNTCTSTLSSDIQIQIQPSKKSLVIEEDYVNKHPIMKTLLLILSHLHQTFSLNYQNTNILPGYIQHILGEIKRDDLHLNLRIFFIKILLNKPEIFEMYLHHFLPTLISYSTDKNSGGKGFHYFMRDVATCILSNKRIEKEIEFTKENVEMMSKYINSLIKLSGDTKNIIFRTNLKIVNDIMDKFRHVIYLNKKTLLDMMKLDDSKQASHIWKITAVQVIASAMEYDIPVGDEGMYMNMNMNMKSMKFYQSIEKNEEVLAVMMKLCESHRTPVQSATIEILAKILNYYGVGSSNKIYNVIYDYLETLALTKPEKESINVIFRGSLHFIFLMERKSIFNKSLILFKTAHQNHRNLLLTAFNSFLGIMIKRVLNPTNFGTTDYINDKSFIDDIYYNLYQIIDIIFVDPNDQLIVNLCNYLEILIMAMARDTKYMDGIRRIVIKINNDIRRKEDYTRQQFYQFLIQSYTYISLHYSTNEMNIYNVDMKRQFLNVIITNLDIETNLELKQILIGFLNKNETMPCNPVDRLIFLLENLNEDNVGGKLIQILTKLILILAANSADYDLKIFEKSLDECEYKDLNVNTVGYYLNRSQPIAPSMAIRSSMDEAYETIVNITQKDASTMVGYLRSTQDLLGTLVNNNNAMVIDTNPVEAPMSINTNTNTRNRNIITSIPISSQDILLSQHSSLVSTTQNYPSMKSNKRNVVFGTITDGSMNPLYISQAPNEQQQQFKIPHAPAKKSKGLGKFLQENEMLYAPIAETNSNKIRFVPDGSNRETKTHTQEVKDVLISKWLGRQAEVRKRQIKLMRQYRIGDLPDIQIKNREIIDPLILLCDFQLEISAELFLELMKSIYKESQIEGKHLMVNEMLERLMRNFNISNFLVISCLHRLILNAMTVSDDYAPDLGLIKSSGLFTKNYHSSILIFEEYIINNTHQINLNKVKLMTEKEKEKERHMKREMMIQVQVQAQVQDNNKVIDAVPLNTDVNINEYNKTSWINLLKFYSKIHMEDYEIGLIQNFADYTHLFLKTKSDFLFHLANLMTKSKDYINKNIDTCNLLKATFSIFDPSETNVIIDELRSKYTSKLFIDEDLKEVVEEYSIKCCSDLGEWDNVAKYLKANEMILLDEKVYTQNPDRVQNLLKSWVYSESCRNEMQSLIDGMNSHTNPLFKKFIDSSFTYYMTLFSIIHKDFDRALLYSQKTKQNFYKTLLNLGAFGGDLKHELIQSIQKIHEIGEFLSFIRGTSTTNPNICMVAGSSVNMNLSGEGTKNIIKLFEKWIERWPSHLYDDIKSFEEIFDSRNILYDQLKMKFYNFEHIISDNPVLDTFIPRSHIEISKSLFKKNFLDIAEIHTRKALLKRKDNSLANAFILYPVLKNKYRILEIESKNKKNIEEFKLNAEKYIKLIKVLNEQIKNVMLDDMNKSKLNILRLKLYLHAAMNYIEEEQATRENLNSLDWFNSGYVHFKEQIEIYDKKLRTSEEDTVHISHYVKLLRPMIMFSDKVIRMNSKPGAIPNGDTKALVENLAEVYMEYGLKGLIMGDKKIGNIIPKLLDILSSYTMKLAEIFTLLSPKVSTAFYLKWKNQLVSYVNSPISSLIQPIIQKILTHSPQSLFFTFTTIERYSDILMDSFLTSRPKSELFYNIKKFYEEYTHLNAFLESLDCLTHPEHRLHYWMEVIKETVFTYCTTIDSTGELYSITLSKIENIIAMLYYDVIEINRTFIGKKLGSYNLKFSRDFEKIIKSNFSLENFKHMLTKKPNDIIKDFNMLYEPIKTAVAKSLNTQYTEGIERLSTFSDWMAQYECNEFYDSKNFIEIPNEYEENNRKKVMISSFDQHLLVLSSVRRPKRLTIYGNDEKSYMFLIKGGEDIRLDQRIQEVFKVYNEILSKDSNCTKKKIKLNRFTVVPMTLKLGMIEWIENTQPLKGVIKYSMQKLFNNPDWDLSLSGPQKARLKWYQAIAKDRTLHEQHILVLHMRNHKEIINTFLSHVNLIPKTVLKKGLEHYLLTPEEILTTRTNFIRNYSALSAACYILGIGDRHLDNFLINIHNSEILAIDFGVAFGQGLTQILPELVPFRLTSQIQSVIYPFGKKGALRQSMIDTLSAFKNSKDYILDYCEVFVKEPLLDWIKTAKAKMSDPSGNSKGDKDTEKVGMDLTWLPMKKLGIIENKLNGMNPITVMLDELSHTSHNNDRTFPVISNIIYGVEHTSVRNLMRNEKYLTVEDQVDVLIEQAIDPNLLARLWIGWSPFI